MRGSNYPERLPVVIAFEEDTVEAAVVGPARVRSEVLLIKKYGCIN